MQQTDQGVRVVNVKRALVRAAALLLAACVVIGCQVVWVDPDTGEPVSGGGGSNTDNGQDGGSGDGSSNDGGSDDGGGSTDSGNDDDGTDDEPLPRGVEGLDPNSIDPSRDADFDPFPVEMATVQGGGSGPEYTFQMSKFEITVGQFIVFLNDCDADAGASAKSANMFFGADGGVYMSDNLTAEDHAREPRILVATEPIDRSSNVRFDPARPRGKRYGAERGLTDLPMNEVSWYGAMKFCNWLTIVEGLGEDARCYSEGPDPQDWHPVTISTADYIDRLMTVEERQRLVDELRGYRLPMENLAGSGAPGQGPVSRPENAFNEWYKAAAYDPAGPEQDRIGPLGEIVSARHWIYGFGRDTVSAADANYEFSLDPFETDSFGFTAQNPPGYYNGVDTLRTGTPTNDTDNPWGLYDLSGNVAEWSNDESTVPKVNRSHYGGSYEQNTDRLAVNYRNNRPPHETHNWLGFRVVRVP